MTENKISIVIPEALFQETMTRLNEIQTALAPYVIALTPDQRLGLPKMGDKSFSFVEKALEYSEAKPSLNPGFIDLAEWKRDNVARSQLTQIFRICEQLCSTLDDTAMLCGSEAYTSSLGFYNNVKQAAKMNVPDAKPIYEDLAKRFPGRPVKPEPVG